MRQVSCEPTPGRRTEPAWIPGPSPSMGIPHEYQEAIFEKFRSIPSALQETSLSTGLGLSIVRGIVEVHRGRVWVESEPGHGATFFVRIPKHKAEDVG